MGTELLLNWMSEVGTGDLADLRSRVAWWARSHSIGSDGFRTGRWLRDVSALGHAEIDWTSGRWAMASAAAALLPACGGTAVLTGSRRRGLYDAINNSELSLHRVEQSLLESESIPPPASLFVQADSMEALVTQLASIGVVYAGEAGLNIAADLKPISLGDPAAPPPWDAPVEHLLVAEDIRFVAGMPSGDGLCRITVLGRPSYLYRSGSSWYHTDHAIGILIALDACGVKVMRWRQDETSGARAIGTLFVDQGAPLPPLQARALVLCSGLPTRFGHTARTAIYRNVPKRVATLVAESVRQTLPIIR